MTELSPGTPLIRVNGQDEPLRAQSVAALLAQKEIATDMRGIAVAVNGRVIPRTEWPDTPLAAGDAIEIVLARQGG
ncbi:MAG TPA: sulfur carrier protein ThiS [Xanthobacteraceae bacterium]